MKLPGSGRDDGDFIVLARDGLRCTPFHGCNALLGCQDGLPSGVVAGSRSRTLPLRYGKTNIKMVVTMAESERLYPRTATVVLAGFEHLLDASQGLTGAFFVFDE